MTSEKRVSYQAENSYSVYGNYSEKTENVWLVFHGMGHLSRYFMRHFHSLNPDKNLIVAPQAPSKYYLGAEYKHVGASWLTKEDTLADTKNVLAYIDAVWAKEKPAEIPRFIVVGYSQGVSIATRWLASRNLQCHDLVIHSGGIPSELASNQFEYLSPETKVTLLYGDKDPYINETRVVEEKRKASMLFGDRLTVRDFSGVHEVYGPFFKEIE